MEPPDFYEIVKPQTGQLPSVPPFCFCIDEKSAQGKGSDVACISACPGFSAREISRQIRLRLIRKLLSWRQTPAWNTIEYCRLKFATAVKISKKQKQKSSFSLIPIMFELHIILTFSILKTHHRLIQIRTNILSQKFLRRQNRDWENASFFLAGRYRARHQNCSDIPIFRSTDVWMRLDQIYLSACSVRRVF